MHQTANRSESAGRARLARLADVLVWPILTDSTSTSSGRAFAVLVWPGRRARLAGQIRPAGARDRRPAIPAGRGPKKNRRRGLGRARQASPGGSESARIRPRVREFGRFRARIRIRIRANPNSSPHSPVQASSRPRTRAEAGGGPARPGAPTEASAGARPGRVRGEPAPKQAGLRQPRPESGLRRRWSTARRWSNLLVKSSGQIFGRMRTKRLAPHGEAGPGSGPRRRSRSLPGKPVSAFGQRRLASGVWPAAFGQRRLACGVWPAGDQCGGAVRRRADRIALH